MFLEKKEKMASGLFAGVAGGGRARAASAGGTLEFAAASAYAK